MNQSLFESTTLRLTLWYMAILMAISLLFSVLLYRVASDELNRALGPRGGNMRIFINNDSVIDLREQMVRESNQRLITNLVLFNIIVLAGGGVLAYVLARRTLQPVEAALDAQSRFSSDAAHELRTPLAVMQSEIEVGLRDNKSTKAEYRNILMSALDEVARMKTLTERLLLLARHEALDITVVDTSEVAIEALNRMIPLAGQKHISIENLVGSHSVKADRDSFVDVVTILLENAIKYSGAQSKITMSSKSHQQKVFLTIKDEGVGIAEHDQARIFDRFYRADTSRSKQHVEGFGLGLSIARRLLENQQGSISVKSSEGKGSSFTISLPKT